jgi:hypothetical protein
MAKTGIRIVAWILLAVITGASGYVLGRWQGHGALMGMLQAEAAGNLVQRIETLSLLRLGNTTAAIAQLESETDTLAVTIANNQGADQRALSLMKTYLSVAPPSPARDKALSGVLAGASVLSPGTCTTALKELVLSSQKTN